jgi:cold shock CspA family protein
MRGEHFYGHVTQRKRIGVPCVEQHGVYATGHVLKLFVGQAYGFIRTERHDDVYFHRSEVLAGHSINDLEVGDAVAFELIADHVSGPRALRVRRC